jgi:hypothetical protein
VRSWESQYVEYLQTAGHDLLATIKEKRALDDDLTASLRSLTEQFSRGLAVDQLETAV